VEGHEDRPLAAHLGFCVTGVLLALMDRLSEGAR
jgi:hypothetical protein